MKSQILFKDNGGFTLIEIMVVISMFVIVASFGLFFDFNNLRSYSFHGDKNILISALQHARSRAVSNICYGNTCTDGKPHGVYIDQVNRQYIVFQGPNFANRDASYDTALEADPNIIHAGLQEVVFSQLTGDATSGDITISDSFNNRVSVISITDVGQIIWTN